MGKSKKPYNWKARQVSETIIDKSEQKKIKVDLGAESKYDDCNALVLPSKKRKTKVKKNEGKVTKLLSKTQRKKLEKIVAKKKKKEDRSSLLESLAKNQVSNDELKMLSSITDIQTKGLKRRYNDNVEDWSKKINIEALQANKVDEKEMKMNSIKGSRKRMRILATMFPIEKVKKDPNIVGVESSSDEISSDEEPFSHDPDPLAVKISNVVDIETKQNVPKKPEEKPKKDEVSKNTEQPVSREPAVFVPVDRSPEIQEARLKLPILAEEQVIMETINENPIVLLVGETGSGKTTQVPQFLYEAGYSKNGKLIGVTEPRRVAAISMAKRLGEELNLGTDKVSYLIRFEGNVTPETEIKFMTDGVLLKEIQSDFLLTKYSVIILDEAHERSVYTDILMGLLSRIVPLRNKRNNPLKLIIMSATLRVKDFTENKHLFKTPPPVIKVESRQFPVSIHFNKRTSADYLKDAYRKACRIHTQLPEGGILLFLTGQQEVNGMVAKLRKAFPLKNRKYVKNEEEKDKSIEEEDDLNLSRAIQKVKKKQKKSIQLPEIDLDSYDVAPNDDTELDLLESEDEGEDWGEDDFIHANAQPMWVLPLYSILPSHKQAKVFQPPPEGCRLCIVATNVAETSLTIPGVKYVIDTGKVKTKLYDKATGVTAFSIVWTSKAGANQRAGRAGRTGPGHCYRLYSSAVFNDEFEEFAVPEMQRRAVDELVLQMKSLGIQRVVNFPFPSPPDHTQLKVAEEKLTLLGALKQDEKEKTEFSGKLTPLGASMAKFPVAPRYAKMLCLSHQHDLLEYTVAIVAAMSIQELLLNTDENGGKINRKKWCGTANSLLLGDAMVLLKIVGSAEYANSQGKLEEFCAQNSVRQKAIVEVRKIRLQLTNQINLLNPDLNLAVNPKMIPPTETQARLLRQILLAGFVDQVARKCGEETQNEKNKPIYNTPDMEDPVQIHSSCALYKEYPEWIVYQEIYETNKIYIRGVTSIEPEWLATFAPSLCNLGEPLETPPPFYSATTGTVRCYSTGTFGRSGWELPVIEIDYPEGIVRYKYFAVFLLDGSMFKDLEKYKTKLLSSPQTMIKTWAKFQQRTENLLKCLISEEIDSKKKLIEMWTTNSKFLLSAYQEWLPEELHNEVAVKWPPKN